MLFVGITTHTDDFSELTEHEQLYVAALKNSSLVPVLLAHTADFADIEARISRLDGLLLIGGGDIHPCHYGRVVEPGIEYMNFNRDRDLCELQLARRAHQLDLPTLGICRGSQVMNVCLGGTLVADVRKDGSAGNHWQEEPYSEKRHMVHIQPETRLFDILFGPDARHVHDIDWVMDTNSMHHQAIEHPAYGLYINAISSDGVYEGVEDPSKTLYLGVQWHPEYLDNGSPLFDALRDACLKQKEQANNVPSPQAVS